MPHRTGHPDDLPISYTDIPPAPAAFKALYDTTGWGPATRQLAFYEQSLAGSWTSCAAYAGDQLAGYARVISDGKLHAFVTEMIIHPDFQRQGMGRRLLDALVQRCLAAGIADIQLFCARGKSEFYLRNGFVSRPADAPGMQYQGAAA